MLVHGEEWTSKLLFVLPNEYVIWAIQIVMYPFITGLVAGAFVLSSLYHLFGIKKLEKIARFALVLSFSILPVALMPLLLHLKQPLRGVYVMMTPHFTSAIAAFGIVFNLYAAIVAMELWFLYRIRFIEAVRGVGSKPEQSTLETIKASFFSVLTLGAWDTSPAAREVDAKAIKLLAGIGVPVALFLHGYAGFIFGSVKANALWMTPLMPVIFIVSAIVSGIALSLLVYLVVMQYRKYREHRKARQSAHEEHIKEAALDRELVEEITKVKPYLLFFLVMAVSLELLDTVFRGYTAVKSWDILRQVIYERDFFQIFILQYGVGDLLPLALLLIPGLSVRRAMVASLLVLFGVFMMRWNVVIGGQSFSLTLAGFMEYHLPVLPRDMLTFKEGLFGALLVAVSPFVIFYFMNKIFPVFYKGGARE